MTNRRPTCFLSYCREEADNDSIAHLVQHLKETSRHQINFLFDEDLEAGTDLTTFMDRLDTTDGVIILLTPEYKKRVNERKGGVYKEFSAILKRYHEKINKANRIASEPSDRYNLIKGPFCLIPLIFSGSYASSCPEELSEKKCIDFSTYRAHRRKTSKQLYITKQTKSRYNNEIEKFVSQIFTYHSYQLPSFETSFEELLMRFFEETKHEHLRGDPLFENVLEKVFVKTHAYKKVKRQTSYLLVGRKGSGKSTISHYLAQESENKYKDCVEIYVNNFSLEYLYTFLSSRQMHADLDSVVSRVQVLEVVWEAFLYICCMNAVIEEYRGGKLKKAQVENLPPISNYLSNIVGDPILETELNQRASFQWCYSRALEILDDAIRVSREGLANFNYDLAKRLEPSVLLREILTDECYEAFECILAMCTRRFLVSLDGFDTLFEEFRIKSQEVEKRDDERRERTRYEIDWLRAFLHVVIEMKSARNRSAFSNLVDFCTTIPKERFIEIRRSERDSYIYIGKCHEIRWSGIELVVLLRKRLELLGSTMSDSRLRPHKRLEQVLADKFSFVPRETITTVAGVDYPQSVFIDVLRHTFWRPREILIYFAKIISVLRDLKRRNMEASQFAIGKCIADTTREVIKTEFMSEFQRHCTNLSEIIEKFRGAKQVLSKKEIEDRLSGIGFHFVDRGEPIRDFATQTTFLYEIGFIGIEADKQTRERLKLLHTDAFWFNAGDEPFELIQREGFVNCKFIIHPIFFEYLDLDSREQRLTLDYTWEYLEQQEAHIVAPS